MQQIEIMINAPKFKKMKERLFNALKLTKKLNEDNECLTGNAMDTETPVVEFFRLISKLSISIFFGAVSKRK